MISNHENSRLAYLLVAFIAGFISVILFHQGMLAFLNQIDFTDFSPYSTKTTKPFGIAAIWLMSFWGGVWGIALGLFVRSPSKKTSYWLKALFFGAFMPTVLTLFVIFPLKGIPVAEGWKLSTIARGLMVNAAWGLGTALSFRLGCDRIKSI